MKLSATRKDENLQKQGKRMGSFELGQKVEERGREERIEGGKTEGKRKLP